METFGLRSCSQKTGREVFHRAGQSSELSLLNFWQWSGSNLLSNNLRGHLAEFIVAAAGGCHSDTRIEWDASDLTLPNGVKLEIKSAAYVQAWMGRPSKISFAIGETRNWQWEFNRYGEARRHSDAYVFCLLAEKDPEKVDPLNLDQWRFFVLPTEIVTQHFAKQKSVGLSRLSAIAGKSLTYDELSVRLHALRPTTPNHMSPIT